MPLQDQTVRPLTDLLLACLAAAVAELESPPRDTCLRAGTTVDLLLSLTTDECCEGLAWVRHVNTYPSDTFPEPNAAASLCAPLSWAVVLELGIARCAPTPGASDIITCTQWTTLAYQIMDDGAAMRRAVCCFTDADPDRLVLVGNMLPRAVEGRCAGSTMEVTVATGDCDCGALEAAS